jgi:hypothetical protein
MPQEESRTLFFSDRVFLKVTMDYDGNVANPDDFIDDYYDEIIGRIQAVLSPFHNKW